MKFRSSTDQLQTGIRRTCAGPVKSHTGHHFFFHFLGGQLDLCARLGAILKFASRRNHCNRFHLAFGMSMTWNGGFAMREQNVGS